MRRRRELKVQKKLDEIQKEGDHGGLLKVHGDSLNPDVPYKSLLLSVTDTAAYVVSGFSTSPPPLQSTYAAI